MIFRQINADKMRVRQIKSVCEQRISVAAAEFENAAIFNRRRFHSEKNSERRQMFGMRLHKQLFRISEPVV